MPGPARRRARTASRSTSPGDHSNSRSASLKGADEHAVLLHVRSEDELVRAHVLEAVLLVERSRAHVLLPDSEPDAPRAETARLDEARVHERGGRALAVQPPDDGE